MIGPPTNLGIRRKGQGHFSDFFQLFILYLYGGVYFDADQVLLRDMWPLYGMHFVYQWSFDQSKFNNAVQGLRKRHGMKIVQHGNKLEGKKLLQGLGQRHLVGQDHAHVGTATYALPCSSWDPFWLRMDGHHTGEMTRPSIKWPEPPNRNWLFQSMHAVNTATGTRAPSASTGTAAPAGRTAGATRKASGSRASSPEATSTTGRSCTRSPWGLRRRPAAAVRARRRM